MQAEDRAALRALVEEGRQAALGTVEDGTPYVSMVLYGLEARPGAMPAPLIHVSRLAAHTRQLQAEPRAALLVMRPDTGAGDPQALARVSIQCRAEAIARDDAGYAAARAAYLARLPAQEYLFGFPDFTLFRLVPYAARYVGGFAKAFSLDEQALASVFTA